MILLQGRFSAEYKGHNHITEKLGPLFFSVKTGQAEWKKNSPIMIWMENDEEN